MLLAVKLLHTAVWAFVVACIVGLPVAAFARRFDLVAYFTGVVVLESAILIANGWKCPLTNVAERYTDERADNFDIFLPLWLAKHNKSVFTVLFLVCEAVVAWRWVGSR